MKKIFLLLAAVGVIFTACEGNDGVEEDNGGTPFVPEITISPKDLTFGCNGGEQAVDITANFEYEVAERASWVTVEQTDEGLLVIVDANKNTSERSAFISITNSQYDINKTVEVWQEGFVPKIELAQQSIEVEFEPAEYEVAVTSPYSWKAESDNDWIAVESETGIAGEEVLRFSTKRNEEEKVRKGTITVYNSTYNLSAELYVTQKAFVPAITIEPETLTFAVEGGTQEVAITVNFEYEASANADWLTIEKSENGISVAVPNYVEVENRTAEITISNEKYGISKVISVTQGAFVPTITIEPETLLFTFEGGTQEVAVTTNFEYEYSTNADWLTIEKSENGVSVTVPNYVEVEERTAEITISNEKYGVSKVVKATQGAFVPTITIEPESLTFASEGSMQQVTVTANFEYEYSTNVDWLTIKKSEKGVNITATTNTKFEERTAEITISSNKYNISKVIKVTQNGLSEEVYEKLRIIYYTSSDGNIVTPYKSDVFGANIVSNTYKDGQGIIIFDAPITSIGDSAFYNCTSLTSVTISDSVTEIGYEAFYNCTSLTSVTIGNNVTSIVYGAFYDCTSLTSVTIPDSVTKIGGDAFYNCTSLTSITIPDSVTSIGGDAFKSCTSLTSVTIGNSVTSIGKYAFSDCTGELIINSKIVETNYTYDNCPANSNNGWLYNAKFTKVTIGNNVTSIGDRAFSKCTSLKSVTIPDSVNSIGSSAFSSCTSLKSVTIPDSVNSIGSSAFSGCTSLTSITIGNSVTSIGNEAFSGCTSLTSVTIGNSVTSIGEGAFYYCTWLTSVAIPDSVTSIGDYAFYECTSLTSVTIGNSVTSIGDNAFYNCKSLTSVAIPDSVTKIGYKAFYKCTKLTSITIPNSVTSIGDEAFSWCESLTSVTIPDSVTKIGSSAFYYCTSLKSVTIPDSVTSIRGSAFCNCTSLTKVYCKPTTPPRVVADYHGLWGAFDNNASGRKIYVPRNSVSAYKAAKYWDNYDSDIVGYDF